MTAIVHYQIERPRVFADLSQAGGVVLIADQSSGVFGELKGRDANIQADDPRLRMGKEIAQNQSEPPRKMPISRTRIGLSRQEANNCL